MLASLLTLSFLALCIQISQAATTNLDVASMVPTKEEFMKAITCNGYPRPSDTQYSDFAKRIDARTFSSKREVAMFVAHLLQESGGLTIKVEGRCKKNACKGDYEKSYDYPGKRYFGRGYLQLTWSYNYKAASTALFGDADILYKNPEIVASDETIAWDAAFWFWRAKVHRYRRVQRGEFGLSTN